MVLTMMASTGKPRLASTCVLVVVLFASSGLALGQKRASETSQGSEDLGAQIDELGTTLKAAAMSGVISSKEAGVIYKRVVQAVKASAINEPGNGRKKEVADVDVHAKSNIAGLMAPRPERIQLLLQPEFLRRDVLRMTRSLDLDRSQTMVLRALFEDYEEAFELAAAPLREGLEQYRGSNINAYIAFALEDAGVRLDAAVENARRVDREEAVARVQETLARFDEEKNASAERQADRKDEWQARMIAATDKLDERLAAIRERTTSQLDAIAREDIAIAAEELLLMAEQLRVDRDQLSNDLIESLDLITTEQQRGEEDNGIDKIMTQIRVDMLLPRGRLGGESMNLWAALTEIKLDHAETVDQRPWELVERLSDTWAQQALARLDARSEATLDREIVGIEYLVIRDEIAAMNGTSIFEIDRQHLDPAAGPYVAALRRELDKSVAARDVLLVLLEESTMSLQEAHPESDLAFQLREAALRRGFSVEMKRRWAERATAAALELVDLDDELLIALFELDAEIALEIQVLREAAIADRIRHDPMLVQTFIDSSFGVGKAEIDSSVWNIFHHAAFLAIDERVEMQLQALLTPSQFASLPDRLIEWDWLKGRSKKMDTGAAKMRKKTSGQSKKRY